jgi:N-acetyl-alpha-D-glucosaminyl L-malate synthase BshA
MKIGIVCYPSVGGSGIVATELGKGLMAKGHEIHFFSYDLPQRLDGSEKRFIFHHVDVPLYPVFRFPPYTLALATSLSNSAVEDNLDLIHVHYAIPHSTSALLAKLMACYYNERSLKVITTLHGTDIDLVGKEPSYQRVVEYSINSSDAVTAVSHYLKKATLEKFRVDREIQVLYNPIDTEIFHPPSNGRFENREEKIVLHISNFRPVKRVVDAVKILDLLRNRMPARLVFLGEGPDLALAEKTARQLGVLDRVDFPGKVDNVADWLRKGDLLLSTSETESFGMSIAEAMATGIPVVSYRVGGIPEVVEDGVQGRLVPMGDLCAATEAIAEILSHPNLQKEYGERGRARIEAQFRLDKIVNQYENLYESVLTRPPTPTKAIVGDCL